MVFQEVTRNKNIRPAAKGLYAYLSSFCGADDECYPSIELIEKEMGMGKTALHNAMNELIAAGVIEKCQLKSNKGKFGRNTYKLTHNVYFTEKPCTDNQYTDEPHTGCPRVDIGTTNSKNLNSNNINNNNKGTNATDLQQGATNCNQRKEKIEDIEKEERVQIPYQQIADMYNDICISFPRLTKLSEARKKAISARYKKYSLEDFKKLFEMAEGSSFLKGGNDRNWSATFDWLVKDSNMAKVLDGNYIDRQGKKGSGQPQPKKPYQQFEQREYDKNQMNELERRLLGM